MFESLKSYIHDYTIDVSRPNCGRYALLMHADSDSPSPREWSNLGTVALFEHCNNGDGREVLNESTEKSPLDIHLNEKDYFAYALNYDSSHGVRTRPFQQWEDENSWCNIEGWIYVSKKDVRKEFGVKRISAKLEKQVMKTLETEIRILDAWMNGNVYGLEFVDLKTGEADACWGFYFMDWDDQKEIMTEYVRDHLPDDMSKEEKVRLAEKLYKNLQGANWYDEDEWEEES